MKLLAGATVYLLALTVGASCGHEPPPPNPSITLAGLTVSPSPFHAGDQVRFQASADYDATHPGYITLVVNSTGPDGNGTRLGHTRLSVDAGSGSLDLDLSLEAPEAEDLEVFVALFRDGFSSSVVGDSRKVSGNAPR